MFSPSFSQPMGVRMAHQARFWESICPLVLETRRRKTKMRRRKTARSASSPRVSPLVRRNKFTSCYGMKHLGATHRKTTPILNPTLFEQIPLGPAMSQHRHRGHAGPLGRSAECARFTFGLMGLNLSRDAVSRTHVEDEPCGKEVTSRRSPSVSQYGSTVILFNR